MTSVAVDAQQRQPKSFSEFEIVGSGDHARDGLRASSIGFSYVAGKQRFEIFRDLSIEVPKGSILAIFGPNGTGKTTLMRSLAGLQKSTGTIRSPARSNKADSSKIGYVPQAFARSFYPWASLETNILLSLQDLACGASNEWITLGAAGATHSHPRGGYLEGNGASPIARSAATVHAFRYSRLSPIAAANVANGQGKPLILLYGGPGRTETSD